MHNLGNIDKNYPYPVIGNVNDFEVSNLFELSIRYGAGNNQYEFLCSLKFDPFRTDLEDLIKQKKIKKGNLFKETLGGCVIKKVNQTVILTKEY